LLRLMSVHVCLLSQGVGEPADTRRAGFDPPSLLLALELQRTVCTLYLVFKEPRREHLLFPIFFTFDYCACCRSALQANLSRLHLLFPPCQQKLFSLFCRQVRAKPSS
jgi:hypothetical protein